MGPSPGIRTHPKAAFLAALVLVVLACGLGAQSAEPLPQPAPETQPMVLKGFRGLHVGMTVEEVKAELRREPLFLFRGDPDVSILPGTEQTLIEVEGRGYVDRGYFQFHDGHLLVLIVMLSPEQISYFEVYQALTDHHGPAASLDPGAAVWNLDGLRLSLERPLLLKYVDSGTFDRLAEEGRAGNDYEQMTRKEFLDTL